MSWINVVSLFDITYPKQWTTISTSDLNETGYPVYGANGVIGYYSKYTHDKETILVTCRGATCGTLNICSPYSYVTGNAMALDKLSPEVELKYLYYFLMFRGFSDVISGSAQPQITRQGLSKITVPVPVKSEQVRISSVLSELDSLIQKRKEAIAKLDELVESFFLDLVGDPLRNPKGWDTVKFGNILEKIDSGWSPKCNDTPAINEEWGVLKLSSVTKGVYISRENKKIFSETEPDNTIEVKKGDLLFTRKNTKELVGACAYVFETPNHLMMPDTIFRFQFKQNADVDKLFLWGLFNNKTYKKMVIQKLAEGSAGSMPNISKKKLVDMDVLLPPLHVQQKVSLFVSNVYEQSNRMQQQLTKLEENFQSLLHQAFTGRLQFRESKVDEYALKR